MKIVRSSVFAVAVALFVASCGNSEPQESIEEPMVEETVEMEAAPVMEEAPVMDSAAMMQADTVMQN